MLPKNSVRPRRSSLAAAVAAVVSLVVGAVIALPACGSSDTTPTCTAGMIKEGDACATECEKSGGVVVNGSCVAKCQNSDCIANNVCVTNACQLLCTSFHDCEPDTQDCLPAKEDEGGKDVFTCQSSDKAAFGTACPIGQECAAKLACPNGDACDFTQCGGATCTKDDVACAGIENCAIGKCADGTTACTVPGCTQAECTAMTCISKGQGDADAYCSIEDCTDDSDCPSSFYCGITHDPHAICNANPNKEKGNNSFCGITFEPCIATKDFKDDGHTYFEGSVCLLRHTCIERLQCDPCAFSGACANLVGGTCVTVGPAQNCVAPCSTNADCQPDYACTDKFCVPRAGECVGKGNFCDPCQNDEDCGSNGSSVACVTASRNTRACFDFKTKSCSSDNDCPTAKSGLHGHCFGTGPIDPQTGLPPDEVAPGDSDYHTCYLPLLDNATLQFGCWKPLD